MLFPDLRFNRCKNGLSVTNTDKRAPIPESLTTVLCSCGLLNCTLHIKPHAGRKNQTRNKIALHCSVL